MHGSMNIGAGMTDFLRSLFIKKKNEKSQQILKNGPWHLACTFLWKQYCPRLPPSNVIIFLSLSARYWAYSFDFLERAV